MLKRIVVTRICTEIKPARENFVKLVRCVLDSPSTPIVRVEHDNAGSGELSVLTTVLVLFRS